MLIQPVAFLRMCDKCREHGFFVLADRSHSRSFASKQDARFELRRLRGEGLIQQDEFLFLDSEISENKGLAPTMRFASRGAIISCSIIDGFSENEEWEAEVEEHPTIM